MTENKSTKTWKVRFVNGASHELITCDHLEMPNSRNAHYNFYKENEIVAKIHMDNVLIVTSQ